MDYAKWNRSRPWHWAVAAVQVLVTAWLHFEFLTGRTRLVLWFNVACIVAMLAAYVITIPSLQSREKWLVSDVLRFVLQAAATMLFLLLAFAAVYSQEGLIECYQVGPGALVINSPRITYDRGDALYFSAITWTTIGYGDFLPTPGLCRTFTAFEALVEYLFLGLFVAVLIDALRSFFPQKVCHYPGG